MNLRSFALPALVIAVLLAPLRANADETQQAGPKRPAQIQWFGNLEQAKAEAKRTNRPILLTAAAPHCGGVPGTW